MNRYNIGLALFLTGLVIASIFMVGKDIKDTVGDLEDHLVQNCNINELD